MEKLGRNLHSALLSLANGERDSVSTNHKQLAKRGLVKYNETLSTFNKYEITEEGQKYLDRFRHD